MNAPNTDPGQDARKVDPGQEGGQVFTERSRIERLGRIRQLVFGSLDGLIVPLGVVSGVAGFSASDSGPVIAAGQGSGVRGQSELRVGRNESAGV